MARELPWAKRFLDNPNSVQVEVGGLQKELRRIQKYFPGSVEQFLRTACTELLGYIISDTPVDTGQARAGWWRSAIAFSMDIESELNDGDNPDDAAQEEGKSQGDYKEESKGRAFVINMKNGVPHIVALEYGHSTQAGQGMVRVNVQKFKRHFQKHLDGAVKDTVENA